MASIIKPLRRRRRTTQRGKSMSQSQRWGEVVTMPVPEGIISTSTGPVDPTEVVQEVVPVEEVEYAASYEANLAEEIEKAEIDLP